MFDHYIAVDWSQKTMAIARMTKQVNKVQVREVPANVKELKVYLSALKGKKILAIEESNPSQWLYTELRGEVDELIVCDPYRNHLLKEGAKNDRIDAEKLCRLLKSGLLKPVFHSGDEFIYLRKLVSGYMDVEKAGVRLKNQREAIFRSNGGRDEDSISHRNDKFVIEGIERGIAAYEAEKARYESEFEKISKKYQSVNLLMSLPGIKEINSVKIAATVVDPRRFPSAGHFLAYCGLIRLENMSGGRSYGWRKPRYSRLLKGVFQNAALTAITNEKKPAMRDYYNYLLTEKKQPESVAKNAVARRLAILSLGVLKQGKQFDPMRRANATISLR